MSRSLLSAPAILVADEPTQGVDVGARAEIYRILRSVSASGVPVIVASSDALELQGLCDRVIVVSRGHCVAELAGDDVTEEKIVNAAMRAERRQRATSGAPTRRSSTAVGRFIRGDYAPVVVLAAPHDRPRRLHLAAERPLPLGLQHDFGDAVVHGARVHRHRSDDRRAARRHRPVGRTALRASRGRRFVLHQRRSRRTGDDLRVRPDGRCRLRRRTDQRVADPIPQVHSGRRHAGDVHRLAGFRIRPTRRAGWADQRRRHRDHHVDDRNVFRSPSSSSSS